MADGQAATAPGTVNDLAKFLADNPELVDPHDEDDATPPRTRARTRTEPTDTQDDDATLAPDPEASEPDDDAPPAKGAKPEDEEDEDATDRTSQRLIKVTVKGDDGSDETREVSEKELVKGYMLQADYSRKRAADEQQKNEISQRALNALETQRIRQLEELQFYEQAYRRHAGIRSPEEMATLARNDPATWVQEQQRQQLIAEDSQRLRADIQAKKGELEHTRSAQQQQAFSQAWGVLGQHGIDKPKLRKIFDETTKHFGIPEERYANIDDPKLVLILQAATKYMELKAQTADATRAAKGAPRLPAQRQPVPRNERLAKQIDARFKGGRAKVADLAAYLQINKL